MNIAPLRPRCSWHPAQRPAHPVRRSAGSCHPSQLPAVSRRLPHISCSADSNSPSPSDRSNEESASDRLTNSIPLRAGLLAVGLVAAQAALPATCTDGGANGGAGWFGSGWGGGPGGSPWFGVGAARADEESSDEEDGEDEDGEEEDDDEDEAEEQVAAAAPSSTATPSTAAAPGPSQLPSSTSKGAAAAEAGEEEDAGEEPAERRRKRRRGHNICTEVVFENYPNITEGFAYPTQEELLLSLNTMAGYVFSEKDLQEDKRNLSLDAARGGLATNVKVRTEYIDGDSNNQRVVFTWDNPLPPNGILTVGIQGANQMPVAVQEDILTHFQTKLDGGEPQYEVLANLVETVRDWYEKKGLPFVVVDDVCIDDSFNMAYLKVQEGGRIRRVDVRYYKEATEGEVSYTDGEVIPREEILRRVRLKPGDIYNNDDAMRSLNEIYATGLLADVRVAPEGDVFDSEGITFKVQAFEEVPNYVEVEADWAFELKPLPTVPRLEDLVPGGAVSFSRGNLFGKGETVDFTITADNLLFPSGGVGFELEFHEPWYKENAERFFAVFQQSKLSPVFTPGPDGSSSNIILDRFGAKLWTFSDIPPGASRMSHGLLLQRVLAMDQMGYPAPTADRQKRVAPLTTLSATAMDISLSYQGYATLDDTIFIGGELLGDRGTVQVDQGLALGGLYNRHSVSWSKFMPLDDAFCYNQPSKTLVLHGRAGNTVGEIPPYEYFALGGPYSVRGYNVGELGACKRFLEAAAELRYPLHKYGLPKGYGVYSFLEYGSDLGSSRATPENPTLFYRKAGKGMSWGAGLKFQGCRFEYARDMNMGKGAWFIQWGERF